MSAKTKNKVKTLACRGCLATGGKLYSILDVSLLEPYEDFTGFRLRSSADQYPKYLCMYCRTQLLSFQTFKKKCSTAIDVLKEAERAGYTLTTEYVSSIDRNYYNLNINFTQTKPEIIECVQNLNYTNVIIVKNDQNGSIKSQQKHTDNSEAAKLPHADENDSDRTEFEDDYEIIDKTIPLGPLLLDKNGAKFVNNNKVFQDNTNNVVDRSPNNELPKLVLDKSTIENVNNDHILQINPQKGVNSSQDNWSDEYLDFDSDCNDEMNDGDITKNESKKKDFVDEKYKKNNILKSLLMNKNSTVDKDAVKGPNISHKSNNNDVAENNVCNIDKQIPKNVGNINKNASNGKNDSTIDRNASDDDDDDEINESDSDIAELINLFLNSPKNYVKIEKKVRNSDEISRRKCKANVEDENRKRKADFAKSSNEIPKKFSYQVMPQYCRLKIAAEKLDFNVQVFTQYEQLNEVDERRSAAILAPCTTKCEHCGEDFKTEALKQTHMEKIHNPNAPYCCRICNCRFEINLDLTLHMRTHKYEFSCKNCKFVTRFKNELLQHYKKHSDDGVTHVCAFCGKVFKHYRNWYHHVRTKHPTKLVSCDLCNATFLNTTVLKKHYGKVHSDLKEVICDCQSTFLNLSALAKHKDSNRCDLFACKRCGVNVSTEMHLKYHLYKHCMQCDMSEDYYFECSGCKVLFQNGGALDVHVERCLEGGYPCIHCGERLGSSDLLTKHMFETHTLEEASFNIKNIKLPAFDCQTCGKSFKASHLLNQHRRYVHLGRPRPRRPRSCCQICFKTFRDKTVLMDHMAGHAGGPYFPCQSCEKVFKWRGALYKHRLRYHTDNPFVCQKCGQRFLKEHLLEAHVAKKHSKTRGIKDVRKKERKGVEKDATVEYDGTEYCTSEYDDSEYLVVEENSSE